MPSKSDTGVCDFVNEQAESQDEQNSSSYALTEAKTQKQKKTDAKMIIVVLIAGKYNGSYTEVLADTSVSPHRFFLLIFRIIFWQWLN